MNDDVLESLLTNADQSTGPPDIPREDLAVNVRRRYAELQQRRNRGAILVGCYLAGVLSMYLWADVAQIDSGGTISERQDSGVAYKSLPRTGAPLANRDDPLKPAVPVVDVDPETPYERYRRLGDDALFHDRSVDLALEFYRRALEAASNRERRIAFHNDSWVLIKLKQGNFDTSL